MTLLNRKVDYGLLILAYLNQKVQGSCAREVADHYGLSRSFVANILKELCQKGFVTSHRGAKGGYVLKRSAETVNLAELLGALDDSFHLAQCCEELPQEHCALLQICPVQAAIADVHRRITDVLRTVSLAELVRPRSLPRPTPIEFGVCDVDPALAVGGGMS